MADTVAVVTEEATVVVTEEATVVVTEATVACMLACLSFRRQGSRTLLARPLVLWRRFVLAIDAGRIHLDLRLR